MKIAILGTRGIPNHYGGFEQLAERLSAALAERGHRVYVYNSSLHPYKESSWRGVNIIHCKDPENMLGTFGQFTYDLNCILDSHKRGFDVMLQLGYTSSSVWSRLMPAGAKVITNMDGLEWKRSKYPKPVQWFLKQAESWAVWSSDLVIADSEAIRDYLSAKYTVQPVFIPYGADPFYENDAAVLTASGLTPNEYFLAIARFEPENNLETIIQGYLSSGSACPLLIIGSYHNRYGQQLFEKYSSRVKFMGPLYDIKQLNNLRFYCRLYFHGHSVGGTNPSLLEAMASQALICAHDNEFNRGVTGAGAFYFSGADDVSAVIKNKRGDHSEMKQQNLERIKTRYSWDAVISAYENVMKQVTEK